jgi:hypothetical protein
MRSRMGALPLKAQVGEESLSAHKYVHVSALYCLCACENESEKCVVCALVTMCKPLCAQLCTCTHVRVSVCVCLSFVC